METRTRILEAAWKLLSSADEAPTRMADIAKEAGVSRQAVYLHFPSRGELLIETTRYIDEVEDVAGQIAAVMGNETGRERLSAFVQAWGNYIPVVHGGAKRLLAIKDSDPDAAAAWRDRMDGLLGVCKTIVETLSAEGQLAEGLTKKEAATVMWATLGIQQWELLTVERKLSQKRYLELTHRTLLRTLID